MVKYLPLAALALLGACTTSQRNEVALSLCEQSPSCTVSDAREVSGPQHVRDMEATANSNTGDPN